MNNTTTSTEATVNVRNIAIGVGYIALAAPFLVTYAAVNIAIWKDRQLFNMVCYKFIFYGNMAGIIVTFGNGIMCGAFELLGPVLSNKAYGILMLPTFSFSFLQMALLTALSVYRLMDIMEWLPYIWYTGRRSYFFLLPSTIYAVVATIAYIATGCAGGYIRVAHVAGTPVWYTDFARVQAVVFYTVSILSHIFYFLKLWKRRASISAANRKKLSRKNGYQLPMILLVSRVATHIYFFAIQPLVPAYAYPGVVAMIMVITFSSGIDGVLTLIFVRSVRNLILASFSFGKSNKIQQSSSARFETRQ